MIAVSEARFGSRRTLLSSSIMVSLCHEPGMKQPHGVDYYL